MPRERIAELSREGKQRVAKLSAEENNEAHREPSAKDALNKYKTAVEAEGKAEKAYMEIQNVIDNDSDRSGGDYYRGGMYAAPLANTWEQAARRYVSSIWFSHHAVFFAFDLCIQYRVYMLPVAIWIED
jgi:hypothetical protein